MLAFIVRRSLLGLLVIFGVLLVTFALTHILPSDPAGQWAGLRATPEQRAKAVKELGLDKPLYAQLGIFIKRLAQGDLGESLRSHRPVAKEIITSLPATLELVGGAILVALLVGVPLGMLSAKHKDRWQDHLARVVSVGSVSMPTFWLGMLLQLVFFRWLHLLPLNGQVSIYYQAVDPVPRTTGFLNLDCIIAGNWGALFDHVQHLILPTITLAGYSLAILTRMTRSTMLEILNEDYITAMRSYGVAERVVLWRFALKNTLGPMATVVALVLGGLIVSTFLVESVFNWAGIGSYVASAVASSDYPAIVGVTLVSAIAYVFLNLLADIVVALDPRVRL